MSDKTKNADALAYGEVERVGEIMRQCGGFTKREAFSALMNHETDSFQLDDVDSLSEFIGRSIDLTSVSDVLKASLEAESKVRVMRADALLAELERTK